MGVEQPGNGPYAISLRRFLSRRQQTGNRCRSGHDLHFDEFGNNLDNSNQRARHKLAGYRFIGRWN